MEIFTAVKRFPNAAMAGLSALLKGTGAAIKSSEVTMQHCQSCGNMSMTKFVAFYRNVGMLFRRQTYTLMGNFCESCVHKHFWKFEFLDVVLGPWGTFSFVITPIYFVQNIFSYTVALYQFNRARTAREFTEDSGFPLLKFVVLGVVAVAALLAVRAITMPQRAGSIIAASAQHDTEQVLCGGKLTSIRLFSNPDYRATAVATLKCGENIVVLDHQNDWTELQTQKGNRGFLPKWYVGLAKNVEQEKVVKCNRPSPMENVEQAKKLRTAIDGFIDAENISGKDFRDTTEDLAADAYFLAYLAADDGGKSKAQVLMEAVNNPKLEETFSQLPADQQQEMQSWYEKTLAVMSKAFDLGYEEGGKLPCNSE